MNVLLVEDESEFRELLSAILYSLDFCVSEAPNGQKALEILKNTESGYFDIICTDYNMPFMDGGRLILEAIKNNQMAKVVILISGRNSDEQGIKELLNSESPFPIFFLEKPFSIENFELAFDRAKKLIES